MIIKSILLLQKMTSGEYIFNRRRRHHLLVDPAQEYFYKNHVMLLVSIAET
ncbi:unnamed protein product [Acanthoscelides obtectus]|uniref:Uncharacterized protein n=1 Tax=Acanthoscelides obtectus TaxID=200917 RepID=A0A9P0L8H8_ACAOB|nr:unnamed protein product [Acanthoscelides obtectus]CAK1649262.1 hypothetical protein AOBTE_LOCUS16119 [Acanthoscelides obtectus]